MNYEKYLSIGEHYVVRGQPYLIRTNYEDIYWNDCKELTGEEVVLRSIRDAGIPIVTHRHVDPRFEKYVKLVFSAVDGTDFHFNGEDVEISQKLR